jgi:3-hydroxyisobutyrate dehydrogenase-like beta-hydroxyacid dehydrogenase
MSDKPVAERLQVKGERRLAVIGASAALEKIVRAKNARAELSQADVVLLFVPDRKQLDKALPPVLKKMAPTAIFWLAYPKLTSSLAGDLSRDVIHALAPKHGLDTVSQIAIDADWSALRLKRMPA